jgi:hypothetical protein
MSQKQNDDNAGLAIVIAMIGIVALFFFAVLLIFAGVLTVLSILAWNKPLKLTDEITILPREARIFVYSGLAGIAIAVVCAGLIAGVYGFRMSDEVMGYVVLGGYVLGSLGVSFHLAEEEKKAEEARQAALLREQQLAQQARQAQPLPRNVLTFRRPQPDSFRFADWRDEPEDEE